MSKKPFKSPSFKKIHGCITGRFTSTKANFQEIDWKQLTEKPDIYQYVANRLLVTRQEAKKLCIAASYGMTAQQSNKLISEETMKNRAERLKDEGLVWCPDCLVYVSPLITKSHLEDPSVSYHSECPHCKHCFIEN